MVFLIPLHFLQHEPLAVLPAAPKMPWKVWMSPRLLCGGSELGAHASACTEVKDCLVLGSVRHPKLRSWLNTSLGHEFIGRPQEEVDNLY